MPESINDSGLIHKAGDVFELIAVEVGLAVDSGSVTEFNSAGVLGLYINGNMTTKELFNKIAVSVAGYYHFIGSIIYLNLLAAPTSVADFVIDDSQVVSIDRTANGLGDNGLPIYGIHCKYDRIETVQNEVAGYVPSARRQRLKSQYRLTTDKDDAVLTRHRLSVPLEIESLLRYTSSASDLLSRLLPIVKARRDVVTVIVPRSETPVLVIGSTGQIITPKLGYSSGRQMVLIGYTIDDSSSEVKLLFYG